MSLLVKQYAEHGEHEAGVATAKNLLALARNYTSAVDDASGTDRKP